MRTIRKLYQFFVDKPIKKGELLNNHYEVLKVIGTGSYGIVYLCEELETREKVVVKQLRPSKSSNRKEVKMFESEISVLRKLSHDKIPTFYGSFLHKKQLFYVMSFIDGDNLEDQIFFSNLTFNEKESLLILYQLLDLVDYLHKKHIYHQDLRIPNILLKNRELFLIDFGLSIHNDEGKETVEMRQQDYYDLGDILLYLLYTTYSSKNKKALPWTEELSLENETVYLLKRLLQIDEPYSNTSEIFTDLHAALSKQTGVTGT
mgnify:CR=1 FL=1